MPKTECATDKTEHIEAAHLRLLTCIECRWDGSIDLRPAGLLALVFETETVDDMLMVRCCEANMELKSWEDKAIGPETDLLVDSTESQLEERFGMGSALREALLFDVEGWTGPSACPRPRVQGLTDKAEY